MRFLAPKIDFVFKKIFGSEESQEILISFLNGIVYDGEKIIKSLTIVNPYNPGQIMSFKDTYLEVKAVLADDSIVMIEMQVARMSDFGKRVLYNMVKGYANQLQKGDDYIWLKPVIAVTITDFVLLENIKKVISKFGFHENTEKEPYLKEELQLIFVELPKFKKDLSELESLADKWIYFLKEAQSFEEIPSNLGEISEIESALNLANQAGMNPEELEEVDRRAVALQDERGKLTYAEEIGERRGLQKGKFALIMRQLTKRFGEIPTETSNKIETLTIEALESLGEDFLDFNNINDLISWLNNHLQK